MSGRHSPGCTGATSFFRNRTYIRFNHLDSSLVANSNHFYFDYKDGKYGYNTNPNRGADTFVPFKSGISEVVEVWSGQSNTTYTFTDNYDTILVQNVLGGNYNPTNAITNNTSIYNISTAMVAIDIFNNVKKGDILTLKGNNTYGATCKIVALQ